MLTFEQIVCRLQDRRLDAVALATGLHPNSIARIRDGKNVDPKMSTLKLLSDYFETRP